MSEDMIEKVLVPMMTFGLPAVRAATEQDKRRTNEAILEAAMVEIGTALLDITAPIIDALAEPASLPDQKQIARQRSRDDLKAKRNQSRRGGNMYRSR